MLILKVVFQSFHFLSQRFADFLELFEDFLTD